MLEELPTNFVEHAGVMRKNHVALLPSTLLLLVCLNNPSVCRSQAASDPHAPSDALKAQVARAKAEGRTFIDLPEPNPYPRDPRDLEDVFKNMVVFVGTLKSLNSDLLENRIQTWASFHIDEDLSRVAISKNSQSASSEFQQVLPVGIAPVKDNEYLVHLIGGSFDVNGVRLRSGRLPLALTVGQRYVVIVSPLVPKGNDYHIGSLATGAQGLFRVSSDMHTLAPVLPEEDSSIQNAIKNELGNDLDLLRKKGASR